MGSDCAARGEDADGVPPEVGIEGRRIGPDFGGQPFTCRTPGALDRAAELLDVVSEPVIRGGLEAATLVEGAACSPRAVLGA